MAMNPRQRSCSRAAAEIIEYRTEGMLMVRVRNTIYWLQFRMIRELQRYQGFVVVVGHILLVRVLLAECLATG